MDFIVDFNAVHSCGAGLGGGAHRGFSVVLGLGGDRGRGEDSQGGDQLLQHLASPFLHNQIVIEPFGYGQAENASPRKARVKSTSVVR